MSKLYISGPMTDYPGNNHALFFATELILNRASDLEIVNPAALDEKEDVDDYSWSDFLKRDLKALLDCTHIVMLPGWDDSEGARLEHYVAWKLGLEIEYITFSKDGMKLSKNMEQGEGQ